MSVDEKMICWDCGDEAARPLRAALEIAEAKWRQLDGVVTDMSKEGLRRIDELNELKAWARQVTDALDGRPLPESPDQSPARIVALREQEVSFRTWLWLTHHADGSTIGLYGDDGEMQCSRGHVLDFKRDPMAKLMARSAAQLQMDMAKIKQVAQAFMDKVSETSKVAEPIFQMAFIHGMKYDGPNYSLEMQALKEVLE